MKDQSHSTLRILVIRTDFSHHGEYSGYKQLLKYINPSVILGVNERTGEHISGLKSRYQWLFELDIRAYRSHIDLIHIFYGEDYLRFSPQLYPEIPIIATFHQPAELLRQEVITGSLRGRIGRLTHRLSRNRFERLAAAIVTEESQKRVLEQVMPAERIHVIPLGVHLNAFRESFEHFQEKRIPTDPYHIITVGNWLRDWNVYAETARLAAQRHPDWRFHLVNRRLDSAVRRKLQQCPNVIIHQEVDNASLKEMLFTSRVLFIPVTGASGNNALLEAMAMGCPVVMTDVFNGRFMISEPEVRLHHRGDASHALERISEVMDLQPDNYLSLKASTFARASEFDWAEIARRTMKIYELVCRK